MKGRIILLFTAIVAILLTIAIYNTAISEWTSTIKLSLAVVCAAELAIVCTMGLLPALNVKNGSTGLLINIYAALMILWAIIGCQYEVKTLTIGLLLISVIMLAIIGFSVMGSHESDRLNEEAEQAISMKRDFATASPASISQKATLKECAEQENLTSMWLTMQDTVDDFDTKKRLRVLIERIQALPANRFPNPVIATNMSQITAMCRALSNNEIHDRMLERINEKIKELSNYLKAL
ncbi:MAG: hypothetical protein HDR87_02140 [Bacteroides sp.]|nr:hypothetical protein [Bacteroides sp.]